MFREQAELIKGPENSFVYFRNILLSKCRKNRVMLNGPYESRQEISVLHPIKNTVEEILSVKNNSKKMHMIKRNNSCFSFSWQTSFRTPGHDKHISLKLLFTQISGVILKNFHQQVTTLLPFKMFVIYNHVMQQIYKKPDEAVRTKLIVGRDIYSEE